MLQAMLPLATGAKKLPPWPRALSSAKHRAKPPIDLSRGRGVGEEEEGGEVSGAGMEDNAGGEKGKLTGGGFGSDREPDEFSAAPSSAYGFPFAKTASKIRTGSLYQYLSKEAIANRLIFLLTIGLIVIFCICVGRDGALGGDMEWISESLFDVGVGIGLPGFETADLQNAQAAAQAFQNSIVSRTPRQIPGLPIVLVIAADRRQVAAHSVDRLLEMFLPVFRELHMNTTAVVWVWDADKPHFLSPTGSTVSRCGVWKVSRMASRYTSGEAVVKYMTGRLNVGVWYVDASMLPTLELASADQLRGVLVPSLFGTSNGFERIDMSGVAVSAPMQGHLYQGDDDPAEPDEDSEEESGVLDALSPPCLPLVYGSIFFAWPTVKTVQFFSDADAWTAGLRGGESTVAGPVDGFVMNALLNSGRLVQHVAPYSYGSLHPDQPAPPSSSLLSLTSDHWRCTPLHASAAVEDALLYATFSFSNYGGRRKGGRSRWVWGGEASSHRRSRRRPPGGVPEEEDPPPTGPEDSEAAVADLVPAGATTPRCSLYVDGDDVCCP